ncbi:class I SAM-dependent methyltransferase [Larkinella soli]|uniref:class I SAM-dependent methyltransferase n=1 Tax=Larkinella soli TaxID=1770527 RepID=UPI000FFCAC5B|nr:class I SAM-dependent methyltransferase [Larkinella soli]
MKPEYYREYYELERRHWWFRVRENILFDHLKSLPVSTGRPSILNVGAATGRSTEVLMNLGKVTSIEYDCECCEFTRRTLGIDIVEASVLDLPYEDDSFDLVCAFDVIEHVEDHQRAVEEMVRVCRPGGYVCLTVPAFMFLWNRHDEVNHHIRRYRVSELLALFGGEEGKVHYRTFFNFWLFFPIALVRLLSRVWPFRNTGRADAGSDFYVMDGAFYQRLFEAIFRSEQWLLRRNLRLPVGLSILVSWQKGSQVITKKSKRQLSDIHPMNS